MTEHRVLIIEDDASLSRALHRMLPLFDVTVCSTVDAARNVLLGERWDAVVSDIEIGDESGLDLFDEVVLRRPELTNRYLFVSGGVGKPDVRARLVRTGAPYLQKPFATDAFTEAVVLILVTVRAP